jgi:alpha-D-ribose 1-methylphosphonate 5-phosphate C-P lyase
MAKKPLTRKLVSVEEKEAALEALEQKRVVEEPQPIAKAIIIPQPTEPEPVPVVSAVSKATREVHRFNIELPMDLYQDIKNHIDHSGQTLKGFLCMCARDYLKNK